MVVTLDDGRKVNLPPRIAKPLIACPTTFAQFSTDNNFFQFRGMRESTSGTKDRENTEIFHIPNTERRKSMTFQIILLLRSIFFVVKTRTWHSISEFINRVIREKLKRMSTAGPSRETRKRGSCTNENIASTCK